MLKVEPHGLLLEYQVKDAVFGLIKSGPKEVFVPYDELDKIQLTSNFFMTRIRLYIDDLKILDQFPNNDKGRITLKIARAQKSIAKQVVKEVKMIQSSPRTEVLPDDFTLIS
jgi:hypothetical protein